MRCSPLAYACFLLPCGVIALCFLISTHLGQIPVCFPFWDGGTSISAAARQDPSIHLFRMVLLPMTPVFALFWWICRNWLLELGETRKQANAIMILGLVGAFFLVLYVVFLGTRGQIYALLRRFGTTLYFGCTGLAQLALAVRLHLLRPSGPGRILLGICVLMLIMGIAYVPAANFIQAVKMENVIEWNFAFLMHIAFGLVSMLWRRDGLRLQVFSMGAGAGFGGPGGCRAGD